MTPKLNLIPAAKKILNWHKMSLIKFNLRPKNKGHYFVAHFFDTKKEMQAWYETYVKVRVNDGANESHFRPSNSYQTDDFAAIVIPFEIFDINDGNEVMRPNIGICLFHRKALGSGLISHEMLHCALWYDRIVNGNINAQYGEEVGEEEERLAYLLTEFVRKFVNKMYKIGVY